MNLADYFENRQGLGVLATADSEGMVDLAIYARPRVIDEASIAFVMREHLSYLNLKSNPHAAYMFVEQGEGYTGKRLYLTKTREICAHGDASNKYLVYFQVENIWPLVGDKSIQ
ncbi:MAG: pyridoxamine 5'-phosphate oxidase family protein [Planctomycetota bacterium]|jgi:hypothetical protein